MITNLIKRTVSFVYNCLNWINVQRWWRYYSKGMSVKRLSKEQKRQIQDYYKPLIGKKINTRWHALLYTMTGEFNVKYLPFDVFQKIAYTLSPWEYHKILDDKNFYRHFFHGFNLPDRLVECMAGVYYLPEVGEGEVSFDKVIDYCNNLEGCIIKPSRDSSGGNGVKLLHVKDGITNEGEKIEDLLKKYGKNFLIERKIENSEILKQLNPTSLNTFRIITYRDIQGRPRYINSFLRIGRLGGVIDNASAGGIVVPVDETGVLNPIACTTFPYREFKATDNGTKLDGYQIERFPELIQTALRAHSRLPMFNIIGWDITIDSKDRIVLVECNPPCDMRIGQVMFKTSYIIRYQEEILKRVYTSL